MTPQKAFDFLLRQFVGRFGASAEGCCKAEDTFAAIRTLAGELGLTLVEGESLEDFIAERDEAQKHGR